MRAKPINPRREAISISLPSHFDAEKIFEDEIRPLMEMIQARAVSHGLPFVLAVGYGHDPEAGFATASSACTVAGRTGVELYIATKLLSNPAFADMLLDLLAGVDPALLRTVTEMAPPQRLM